MSKETKTVAKKVVKKKTKPKATKQTAKDKLLKNVAAAIKKIETEQLVTDEEITELVIAEQKKIAIKEIKKTINKSKPKSKLISNMGRPTIYEEGMEIEYMELIEKGYGLIEAANEIGINHETVRNWSLQEDHNFFGILQRARDIRESLIVKKGLNGDYSSQFAMFLLRTNFKYIEEDKKQTLDLRERELDNNSNDGEEINVIFELDDG